MQITVGEFVYSVYLADATTVMPLTEADQVVAIDTETEPFVDGQPYVPVILQVCHHDTRRIDIVDHENMREYLRTLYLQNPQVVFVLHNAPFDLEVLGFNTPGQEWLTTMINDGRIVDTALRYNLGKISNGDMLTKESLDYVAKDLLNITVDKDPALRLSFRQGAVLSEAQMTYAAIDSAVTRQIYAQMPQGYPTEGTQLCGAIALHDISRRGICVDVEYMKKLREEFQVRTQVGADKLAVFGYHVGVGGVQAVLQQMMAYIEKEIQFMDQDPTLMFSRTPTGLIQMTEDSLVCMGNHTHPFVDTYLDHLHAAKILTTYLDPVFIKPDLRVHCRFNPIVTTGRTSCSTPNIQNLPRKEGVRGMYVPAPGCVFYSPDYCQLELCTLGASCLHFYGRSTMADLINSGVKVHNWFAGKMTGKNPDDINKAEKQGAKACNFGFPGGLGLKKFQHLAKYSYDVDLPLDRCKELKTLWLDAFPEMKDHLKPPEDPQFSVDGEKRYIGRTVTGRIRRNCPYCAACNYPFQGLAADGAKLALWYCRLEGFPMVNFIHDEIMFELPEDKYLQQRIRRIDQLMIAGMQEVVKTVKIKVEGTLMRRWYKEAEPVWDEHGNMVVWEPEIHGKK